MGYNIASFGNYAEMRRIMGILCGKEYIFMKL
jgi:hypothetical protein